MAITVTLSESQYAALKGILALVEPEAPAVATEPKAQPASLVAAKQHCYDRRMARRANTALGGLTKAERSALYRAHPELSAMSKTARAKAWAAIVADYKAEEEATRILAELA